MRRAVLSAVFLIIAMPALAQETMDMPAGVRGEIIGQLMFAQSRLLDLEQAFPQNLFTWRPAEGVRSVSEVFLHTAFGNYLFLNAIGAEIPKDANWKMDPQAGWEAQEKKWDVQSTDKQKIAEVLKKSFADAVAGVKAMPDEDLDRMITMFGMDFTIRNFSVSMIAHLHEHLGQAIAYARMNGVVPPWTAKQQQEEGKEG